MHSHLIISTDKDLLRVAASQIIYVQSDGNYSTIFMVGGESKVVTMQLGQIVQLIESQLSDEWKIFARIGKSLIINLEDIYYISIPHQKLVLADKFQNVYTLTASKEALKALKELIERQITT